MIRQLLRESTVVIDYNGRALELKALSSISGSSSLGQATDRRKTLFANSPKQYNITNKVNPTQINLSVPVTEGFPEALFLDLVGMSGETGSYVAPVTISTQPKICGITLINSDSVMRADNCFVESVNVSLSKASILTLDVVLSAATLIPSEPQLRDISAQSQGSIVSPASLLLTVGSEDYPSLISATISIQQEAEWVDDKNLFSVNSSEVYTHTKAQTNDLIISSTVVGNYLAYNTKTNDATDEDILICKGDFSFYINNARIVHNLDLQSIYQYRLDISYTELSGEAKFYFGE